MTNPDGEGYYAFEGAVRGASVESVQWVVCVLRNVADGQSYAHRLTGYPVKVSMMHGEWTPLRLPWDTD